MLVPRAEHDGMAALALRVLEAVREGDMVRVSVGWAIASGSEKLLHDADDALAAAKRGGKDQALAAT